MESLTMHRGDCVSSQIVDQTQVVLALWANVNVPAIMILELQPGHRAQQRVPIPHPEQHARVSSCCLRPEDSDFEQFAAHSGDLLSHRTGGCAGCHCSTPGRNNGCEPLSMVAAALFKKRS